MFLPSLSSLTLPLLVLLTTPSQAQTPANIPIRRLTDVNTNAHTGYFSDPYHVPYSNAEKVFISGTTHSYLSCSGHTLSPKCASGHTNPSNDYISNAAINKTAHSLGVHICGAAGIHPFQSGSADDNNRSWDAVVTLHVSDKPCEGISGWSVIVHAHPQAGSGVDTPPTSWVGDKVLIGSFKKNEDANYDGKYFRTPEGELYLVYQKQYSPDPKRDGVVAWRMDDPKTFRAGTEASWLLRPDEELNSEDYMRGNGSFKLIETGNIRAINGKFVMAYSVGAYDHRTYKLGVAYSDTFLPASEDGQYRKVMKKNTENLWGSGRGKDEVWYLLQADENQDGWRYVGDQVLAPGVPTIAQIGPDNSWVVLFAGYDPADAPVKDDTDKFEASHRRPYFARLNVSVPATPSVKQASDEDLQNWITPAHG